MGCKSPPWPTPRVVSIRLSQDKLSSQSFGTDLPLVDHQVEQHNIFHNEVKAIGPHLAKDGAKVGTTGGGDQGRRGSHVHRCSNLCSRLCSQEQNSELQAKYQKLLVRTAREGPGSRPWGREVCAANVSNRMEGDEVGRDGTPSLCLRGTPVYPVLTTALVDPICLLGYNLPCNLLLISLLSIFCVPSTMPYVL